MLPRRIAYSLCAAWLAWMCGDAAADPQRRALLVGVSDYPKAVVGDLQLAGPRNDVALMLETLDRIGVARADTIVLADGLEQTGAAEKADGAPTRAAIFAALAELADKAHPGDFVLVYLSGHGSQQPMIDASAHAVAKADGLEEIFLPIDIGPWEDSVSAVKNAVVDYELGRAVNAIRAKGASVWVVIDACHSGTMTRSAGDASPKQVPPSVLRVPAAALARAGAAAPRAQATRSIGAQPVGARSGFGAILDRADAATPPGGYVGFFAAWPDQVALQRALPRGYGVAERKPHGVLTFYLAQALRSGRAASFRDLAHQVMAGYDEFGQAPTPMFEGDLSASAPGGTGAGILRWPVEAAGTKLTVGAGVVDGLGAGAIVALATSAAPDETRAFARVRDAGAARAVLEPIERDGLRYDPALAGEHLLARLVEKAADFLLTVARPPRGQGEDGIILAAAEAGVRFVEAAEPADLRLYIDDGRLWLLADGAEWVRSGRNATPSLALAGEAETSAQLKRALTAFARSRNLIRTAELLGAGPIASSLQIEGFVLRDSGVAAEGAAAPDDRACPRLALDQLPAGAQPLGEAPPELHHCDALYFRLANKGAKPIDVTPLYVDGAGGITYMGPQKEGIRLDPGAAPQLVPLRIVTWDRRNKAPYPTGRERLLFVAVEVAGREALAADFRYLAQSAPTRSASGAPNALRSLLESAAFGGARAVSAPSSLGAAGIVDFGWRVAPP